MTLDGIPGDGEYLDRLIESDLYGDRELYGDLDRYGSGDSPLRDVSGERTLSLPGRPL